jgi:hypothetical protein
MVVLPRCAENGEVVFTEGLVPPVLNAFRDAPALLARLSAAQALLGLGSRQQRQRKVMVQGGVMRAVVEVVIAGGDSAWATEKVGFAWELAYVLLCTETAAVRDLQRVISGPHTDQAFTALVVLHVRLFPCRVSAMLPGVTVLHAGMHQHALPLACDSLAGSCLLVRV